MVKLFGLFDASKDGEANCPTRLRPPGTTTFDAEPALAFGAAVRVARLTQGVAQEELAAKAGIERSHMGKIERGEHMPNLALILRIAAGLQAQCCGTRQRSRTTIFVPRRTIQIGIDALVIRRSSQTFDERSSETDELLLSGRSRWVVITAVSCARGRITTSGLWLMGILVAVMKPIP